MASRSAALNCRCWHDLHHQATDQVGIGCHAGGKRLGEFLDFPIVQLALRDVGDAALPGRARASGKAPAGDDRAQKIARRMTFGAVAGAIHEISAAIPLRGLRRIRRERFAVEKQQLPNAKRLGGC